ncbi:MAG: leucyl/phenylalanyl-tRNA--protein transferase [Planctomycetia bacterium TMED53]|nr:MAG: leucyl/phenylalanyl-tRNA--protein transferase [Planctomycetia bacterium TMED53]
MKPIRRIRDEEGIPVSPARVLRAYGERCFPMADHRDGRIFWIRPYERAVIHLDEFHIPTSLKKLRKKKPFRLTTDVAFRAVIEGCAERRETWICRDIEELFVQLHALGFAHSIEAWDDRGRLVGGAYGLSVGGVFAGESMFHIESGASKLCIVALVEHLKNLGYRVLDCQQQTPHMQRFGAELISDDNYASLLSRQSPPLEWRSHLFPQY